MRSKTGRTLSAGLKFWLVLLFCISIPVLAQTVDGPTDPTRLFVQGGYMLGYRGTPYGASYPRLDDTSVGVQTTNTPLYASFQDYNVMDDGTTTTYTFSVHLRGEGASSSYFMRYIYLNPVVPSSGGGINGSVDDADSTAITNLGAQCTYSSVASLGVTEIAGTDTYRYITHDGTPTDAPMNAKVVQIAANLGFGNIPGFPLVKISDSVEVLTFRCEVPSAQIKEHTVFGLAVGPGGYDAGIIGPDVDMTSVGDLEDSDRLYSIVNLENNFTFRPASTPGGIYTKSLRLESDGQGAILEFTEGVSGVDRDGSDFQLFDFNYLGQSTESIISAVEMQSSRTYHLRFSAPLAPRPSSSTQIAGNLFGLERVGAIDGVTVGRLGALYRPIAPAGLTTSCLVPRVKSASLDPASDELTVTFDRGIYKASSITTADFIITHVTDPSPQNTALGSVSVTSVALGTATSQFVVGLEYRDRVGTAFPSSYITGDENFTLELREGAFRCTTRPFIPAEEIQTVTLRIVDTPPQISLLAQEPSNICATKRTVTIDAEDVSPGISRVAYKTGSDAETVCSVNNTHTLLDISTTPAMGAAVSGSLPFTSESDPQPLCFSVFEANTNRETTMVIVVGVIDTTIPTLAVPTVGFSGGITSVSVVVTDSSPTCGVASDLLTVRAAAVASSVVDCSSVNFDSSQLASPTSDALNGSRTYTYFPFISDNNMRICFQATDGAGGTGLSNPSEVISVTQDPERVLNVRVFIGGAF